MGDLLRVDSGASHARCFSLFALGFRPFFLATGLAACSLVPIWLLVLEGRLAPPAWLDAVLWHGHEMVFGLATAAIAGFLLTAVPVWTGTRPVSGTPLAVLAGLWLLGRLAMGFAGVLPGPVVAVADLAFPAALAVAVGRPIARARAWRNAGIVAVLAGLAAADAATHLDALGAAPGAARPALRCAVVGIAILILVIGGRITPAFTRNALRRAGASGDVRSRPRLDRLALAGAAAVALAELAAPRTTASGVAAAVAALASAGRMAGWRTGFALRDPLLASLHAGHAWVSIGFAAMALSDLTGRLPASTALHALSAGAMGAMILAVMTRVALGHTGRPLVAPASARAAYLLVNAGALLRVGGPLLAPGALTAVWNVSGLLWAGAFAAFLAGYAPLLLRARLDGRPG